MPKEKLENQLPILKPKDFLSLSGASGQLAEALGALEEAGEEFGPDDIPRIKNPSGGSTKWETPSGEYVDAIEGAFLFLQTSCLLWPTEGDATPGTQPVLRSWDTHEAEIVSPPPAELADEIQRCTLPNGRVRIDGDFAYTQWGSGKTGAKRMQETRLVFILPPGEFMPWLVTVKPGSLKDFTKFVKQKIAFGLKVPYWACQISLGLEKATGGFSKQGYSKLVPSVSGLIDPDAVKQLNEKWRKPLQKMIRQFEPDAGDEGLEGAAPVGL